MKPVVVHSAKLKLQALLCLVLSLVISLSANAISDATWDEYGINGIYYYNPTGLSGSNALCSSVDSGTNYAGASVFTDAQMKALIENMPTYEKVAEETGIPWQILATLHYKEHNLLRSNPSNGQGAYQLYSYTRIPGTKTLDPDKAFLPEGSISTEEFERQTRIVADLVKNNYGAGLDLTKPEDIQRLFYKYNGTGYNDKALAMGYSEEEAYNGAGSVYVFNRYDPKRDPTSPEMDVHWPGRYTTDGGWSEGSTTNRFGAWVVYEALGGSGVCSGGLVSGGLTYEQAYDLVKFYVDNPDECRTYTDMCNIYSVEVGGNCVTFSSYFLGKYTTMGKVGLPNGRKVVGTLENMGLPTGTEPRPYAIFSTDSGETICSDGRKCGHTGVVLGVNEETDEIYIGQMSYSRSRSWGLGVIRGKLSRYRNGSYTYAYTDSVLKTEDGGFTYI